MGGYRLEMGALGLGLLFCFWVLGFCGFWLLWFSVAC